MWDRLRSAACAFVCVCICMCACKCHTHTHTYTHTHTHGACAEGRSQLTPFTTAAVNSRRCPVRNVRRCPSSLGYTQYLSLSLSIYLALPCRLLHVHWTEGLRLVERCTSAGNILRRATLVAVNVIRGGGRAGGRAQPTTDTLCVCRCCWRCPAPLGRTDVAPSGERRCN